jgi:hypothetical protein
MKCASKAMLVIMVMSPLALWGCAQNKNCANYTKIRDLETRNAKLQDDYRAILASREITKKRLAQADTQRAALAEQVKQLEQITRERDELARQLAARTGERDNLHGQMTHFSKELQLLAGRIEAAAANPFSPSLTANTPPNSASEAPTP